MNTGLKNINVKATEMTKQVDAMKNEQSLDEL